MQQAAPPARPRPMLSTSIHSTDFRTQLVREPSLERVAGAPSACARHAQGPDFVEEAERDELRSLVAASGAAYPGYTLCLLIEARAGPPGPRARWRPCTLTCLRPAHAMSSCRGWRSLRVMASARWGPVR